MALGAPAPWQLPLASWTEVEAHPRLDVRRFNCEWSAYAI